MRRLIKNIIRLNENNKKPFLELFGEALKSIDSNAFKKYHKDIPRFRGITLDKIKKYLKSIKNNVLYDYIDDYSSLKDLNDHIYFHGTTNYIPTGLLRPGAIVKNTKLGGGYGDALHTISLTKSKKVASTFQGSETSVSIYEVLLLKNSRIINMEGKITDSNELEDYIVELWENKIDGVWIGGGEQELAILNPKCIVMLDSKSYYVGYKHTPIEEDEKNISPYLLNKIERMENLLLTGKNVNKNTLNKYKDWSMRKESIKNKKV